MNRALLILLVCCGTLGLGRAAAARTIVLSDQDTVYLAAIHRDAPLSSWAGVHQGTLRALRYAQLLSDDITAVHIGIDAAETEKVKRKWEMWGDGVRLEVLESPYRTLLDPLLTYISEIAALRQGDEALTIVVPQFVTRHWWNNLLHTHTATWLRLALLFKPGIIITDVPYQVE